MMVDLPPPSVSTASRIRLTTPLAMHKTTGGKSNCPTPTQISKIVITSRSGWGSRIKDAGVYVSNAAYTGTLNDSEKVATLAGITTPQTFTFSTPKAGTYLIVKATGSNCLHMSEVDVFGQAPAAPQLAQAQYDFLLRHDTPDATVIGQVTAVDYQQDTLKYAVEGDVPFAVDNQGVIRVKGALQAGQTYDFQLAVSDGKQTSRARVVVNVTATDAVTEALRTGRVTAVTDTELLDATLDYNHR